MNQTASRLGLACAMVTLLFQAASAQDRMPSAIQDEIFARKLLMDTVDSHLDAIDWILSAKPPVDLPRAIEHADTISAMLLALPHLFPPATNRWRVDGPQNPARDTFAAPELWTNFDDFYRRAGEASQLALAASRAKKIEQFKLRVEELRDACEACHALYTKGDKAD